MNEQSFRRYAIWFVTAALLAGCGGSQPPVGASGAVPLSSATTAHAKSAPWMLPEAKNEDLLYLASTDGTNILSYPQGKLVGSIDAGAQWTYLCSDQKGNVFFTEFRNSANNVVEYAHGGTTPIATLNSPGYPWSCSVDPVSGNLAVANYTAQGNVGNIAVFTKEQGTLTIYSDPAISSYTYCGYDASGDLFIDGVGGSKAYFAELPKGGNTFTNITLDHGWYGSDVIEWDGKYITLADALSHSIFRVQVSGSTGSVVSIVSLKGWHQGVMKESWLQNGTLIAQPGKHGDAGLWRYPRGGKPSNVFHGFAKGTTVEGITVSVAQK
jgi:hypothetical protein